MSNIDGRSSKRVFTEEWRRKISEAKKGKVPSNTGLTKETSAGLQSVSEKAKTRWADPEFRARMQEKQKAFWANKENRERMQAADKAGWKGRDDRREAVSRGVSAFRKGRPLSPAHRAAISAGGVGRVHSEETKIKISEANRGRVYTPEQLEVFKRAAMARELALRPLREKHKEERQILLQALWHKCSCSESCTAIVKDPELEYARGHHPKSKTGLGAYYPFLYFDVTRGSVPMRGSWEVLYAHYLDATKIVWEYEPHRFEIGVGDWDGTAYIPDFYLPASDAYVEVKGYLRPENARKMKRFAKLHPSIKLSMVRQEQMDEIRIYFGLPKDKKH